MAGGGFDAGELNLIDRHVLREWLYILALTLGAALGILLIQAMIDDFRDVMDAKAELVEIIIYYAIKIPGYFATVLPIALLVSLLYSLGQLHRNNEITAMRAAGVGIVKITRSIWIVGILMCGVVYALNSTVVPRSIDASRRMFEEIKFRNAAKTSPTDNIGLASAVTFDNQKERRMWFMNRFSKYEQRGFGVAVSEVDDKHRVKTMIRARTAKHLEKGGWIFYDGRETWIDPETGELQRSVVFAEKKMPYYNEDPDLMMIFDRKPGDLSLYDLERIIEYFKVEENPKATVYALRYFELLAETIAPLIVLILAIPFAVAGVRVNPAVGVSKSIGLFVIYFILMKAANAMGARLVIEPQTAAILPSMIMLGVGGFFFLRMR